jgi:hypothetical protein
MKIIIYLIAIIFIVSCKKENTNTVTASGLLEGFLNDNPEIIVRKTTYAYGTYNQFYSTYRGYIFKPLSDIKISAVGAKVAGYGNFRIEISHGWAWEKDTLLIDSVAIDNTAIFQFKNINHELILKANEEYLIMYFNVNHDFVYDAGLGYNQSDLTNIIRFPLTIKDVQILSPYYIYKNFYKGKYYAISEGQDMNGVFRGLVDFKYELVK